MQKILHTAGRGLGTVARAEMDWEYSVLLTHPQSDAEVREKLKGTGMSHIGAMEAISNTAVIAERCDVELPKAERLTYPATQRDMMEDWG
jgi:DNA polymerase-3 subunit alpha